MSIRVENAGRINRNVPSVTKAITSELEARETQVEDRVFTERNVQTVLEELNDYIEEIQDEIDELETQIAHENLWDRSGTTLEPHNAGDGIDVQDVTTVTMTATGAVDTNSLDTASLEINSTDVYQIFPEMIGLDGSIATYAALVAGYPPTVTYRYTIAYVAGGGGARDRLYWCLKGDAGTYSWVELANGGA